MSSAMTWRRVLSTLMIALCAIGLFGARPAMAEPTLIDGTQPADGQNLPASPADLLLVFSEPLGVAPLLTVIEQTSGLPVAIGAAAQGDSAEQWIVPVTTPLNTGTYRVTWVAGVSSGNYVFTIGAVTAATTAPTVAGVVDPAAPTTIATAPGDTTAPTTATSTTTGATGGTATDAPSAGLAGVLGRLMSSLGIAALIGALVLIVAAWPEGVEYSLTITYLRVVWVVGLIGMIMVVVAERAAISDSTFAGSLSPMSWADLGETTAGKALLARLLFTAASGWVAFNPERAIDAATQIPAVAAPALVLLTFGFPHATESGLGALTIPAGILHATSMAVWFGGLALLVRVVLAGPGDEDLVHAVRGFSKIAAPALLGVFVSGLFLVARYVGGLGNLFSTGYGRFLLLKIVAFIFMLRIALANRSTVAKRLTRTGGLGPKAAERLRRAIGTEALAGVAVIGMTAAMFSQHPAGLDPLTPGAASTKADKPAAVAELSFPGAVNVSVGVGPARAGLNDLTIIVEEPVTGLVAMEIRLEGPTGDPWWSIVPVSPPLGGAGTLTILDVPLCTAGEWSVKLTGQNTESVLPEIRSTFSVKATDDTPPAICTSTTTEAPTLPAPANGTTLPAETTVAP